jgi:16S rRNA C1402 N4-methylase RsmH
MVRSNEYGETLSPWKPMTKIPKFPSNDEIATNVRARSAKLRVAERTGFQK